MTLNIIESLKRIEKRIEKIEILEDIIIMLKEHNEQDRRAGNNAAEIIEKINDLIFEHEIELQNLFKELLEL